MGSLRLPPTRLRQRVRGDDWIFEGHRTAGTSGWVDTVVDIRRGPDRSAILVATSRTDDEIPAELRGSAIIDGYTDSSEGLDVPASDFPAGDMWVLVRRPHTIDVPVMQLYMEVSSIVTPYGRQTRGFFTFPCVGEVATEVLT